MHHDNGIWVSTEDLSREESFLQSAEREFSVETIDQTDGKWQTNRRDFLKLMGFGLGAATVAASCDVEARAIWQGGVTACNRRRVLRIRRYEPPTFMARVVGRGVLSTLEKGLLPNVMDGAKAGPQRGRRLASPWLFCSTYVQPHPIGPCRASPFPCFWKRPRRRWPERASPDSKECR